ncbi:uncharacterized protein LOC124282906 isoform X1 [Haliotis rubra]|uniref:uncharacterized protein LOC124282906 isoform X1 n=1 Tax=Haliotis rubra TaxID=36100 RepID=UPI001EE5551E|nr:uncharacterized protein LOC124282906 isoform X1 [Haliotis rubra]
MSNNTTEASTPGSPTDAYVIAGCSFGLLVLFVIFLTLVSALCRLGCGCNSRLPRKAPEVEDQQLPTGQVHEYSKLGVGRRRHKYDYPTEPIEGMCRPYAENDIALKTDLKSAFSASQGIICKVSSRDDLNDDAFTDVDDDEGTETEVMNLTKGVSVRIKDGRFHKIVDIQFE